MENKFTLAVLLQALTTSVFWDILKLLEITNN